MNSVPQCIYLDYQYWDFPPDTAESSDFVAGTGDVGTAESSNFAAESSVVCLVIEILMLAYLTKQ